MFDRFVPEFPLKSMMGKLLQMVMRDILRHFLQRFHYESVKRRATLVEQGSIGNLGRKSMFERILHLWKQISFIEEFSGLKMRDVVAKVIFRQLGHSTQQRQGNDHADNRGNLQEPLFLTREPVDTVRQNILYGVRNP